MWGCRVAFHVYLPVMSSEALPAVDVQSCEVLTGELASGEIHLLLQENGCSHAQMSTMMWFLPDSFLETSLC